jgi:hypothetical protein
MARGPLAWAARGEAPGHRPRAPTPAPVPFGDRQAHAAGTLPPEPVEALKGVPGWRW